MSAPTSPRMFVLVTLVAAVVAAVAATASQALSLPVWAMFIGWIAFFTRGLNAHSAIVNLGCAWVGMALGAVAALSLQALSPTLGALPALSVVVFAVALLVVSLRGIPVMNNLLGYFLGLVAWFAAHLEPAWANLGPLFAASALGSAAGWLSHALPQRSAPAH